MSTQGSTSFRRCCIKDCPSDSTKNALFAFPVEWKILCEWLDFAKANGAGTDLKGGICQHHFTKNSFVQDPEGALGLKFLAVPTLSNADIEKERQQPTKIKVKKSSDLKDSKLNLIDRFFATGTQDIPNTIRTVQGLPCPLCCDQRFYSRRDLRNHLRFVLGKKLKCSVCEDTFPSIRKLITHLKDDCLGDLEDEEINEEGEGEQEVENESVEEENPDEHMDSDGEFAADDEDPLNETTILHLDHTVAQQVEITSAEKNSSDSIVAKRSTYRLKVNDNTHKCPQCGKEFKEKNMLMAHLRKLHGSMAVFKCRKCDFKSPDWNDYIHHSCGKLKDVHFKTPSTFKDETTGDITPTMRYLCPFKCGAVFPSALLKLKHKTVCPKRVDLKNLRCKKCNKVYDTLGALKKHHDWHLNHEFPCPHCPSILNSRNGRLMHIRENHRQHITKVNECKDCGLTLPKDVTIESLKQHVCQPMAYACLDCSRRFMSKTSLEKHLVSHTKETLRNICDECGAAFCHFVRLQDHIKMHQEGTLPTKPPKLACSVRDLATLPSGEHILELGPEEEVDSAAVVSEYETVEMFEEVEAEVLSDSELQEGEEIVVQPMP